MISKSVKAKRRRDALFYALVRNIKVTMIDQRLNHYLVSMPTHDGETLRRHIVASNRAWLHLESESGGHGNMLVNYRQLLDKCRHLSIVYHGKTLA